MSTPTWADRRRVAGLGLALLLVASACGTDEVGVDEPVPTLFPPESSTTVEPDEPTTTTTTTVPVAELLPPLVDPPLGAVVTATGVVGPMLERLEAGWRIGTPCGAEAAVGEGVEVGARHVVLDPGHGGTETGAVGEDGLLEKDLNLDVAIRVAALLEAEGVAVLLTRTDDIRLTLASRAEIARSVDAMALVSIHHNADPDGPSEAPGTEVWYQIDDPESRRLSGLVYEESFAALEPFAVDWVADDDAGVKYRLNQRGTDYYGILRESAGIPAALAELAFLSNPAEEALLAGDDYRDTVAAAVADGIIRFLVSADAGSGFVEPYDRVEPAGPGGGAQGCVDPPLGPPPAA